MASASFKIVLGLRCPELDQQGELFRGKHSYGRESPAQAATQTRTSVSL